MKKFFAFMAIAMCAMFFTPSVVNATEPAVMESTATPRVAAAQSETLVVVIETNDEIIIIVIQ